MPTAPPRCDPASAEPVCPGLGPSPQRSRCPESRPESGRPSSTRCGLTDLRHNTAHSIFHEAGGPDLHYQRDPVQTFVALLRLSQVDLGDGFEVHVPQPDTAISPPSGKSFLTGVHAEDPRLQGNNTFPLSPPPPTEPAVALLTTRQLPGQQEPIQGR